ncbi:MAG: tryptophan 7-halogenase [Chromatiales bacterium]|jgi:flavin-dependent dehydrogenase
MSKQSTKTVIIIGAGPAACATALSLLHASSEPLTIKLFMPAKATDKPAIGETIPPAASPALRDLGLNNILEQDTHIVCPGSVSIWGDPQPGNNDFLLQPVGRGYHLDRTHFDAQLREQVITRGGEIHIGWKLRHVRADQQGYKLGFNTIDAVNNDARLHWEYADHVIDASGIAAAFARRLNIARNLLDEVIALCAVVPIKPQTLPAHTLIQTCEHGWWYAARLPSDKAIIALTTDALTLKQHALSNTQNWLKAFQESGWLAEQSLRQFGRALCSPAVIHSKSAPSAILSAVIGKRWLAVGDAASSYDSMSSAGITKALIHGKIAGHAIADYLSTGEEQQLKAYQDRVFADFNTYIGLHQQHYRSEQRFTQSGFWQRRRIRGYSGKFVGKSEKK